MPRTGTNIYKRKDGRWEARYIKGYDYNGKAKYGYVYAKTYKEAKAKQTRCLSNSVQHTADSKNSKTNDTHSLSFWLDRRLELKKVNVKESSFIRYKNNVELHINVLEDLIFNFQGTVKRLSPCRRSNPFTYSQWERSFW